MFVYVYIFVFDIYGKSVFPVLYTHDTCEFVCVCMCVRVCTILYFHKFALYLHHQVFSENT